MSQSLEDQTQPTRRVLNVGASGEGRGGRRYRIVSPLDKGGMGELFLAQVSVPGEPSKLAVIKRLLADLIDDPKYAAMFRAEAAIMSRLSHDNIVSVYDTPVIAGMPCLAMEYVRGKNVQQILSRCEDLDKTVPAPIALKIMTSVLRGLHYAHTFVRDDGTPLNLVHRDVSPGNVLISLAGEVKLTDFGIAKTEMSVVTTTVGIVKGKARYLAPEQIMGEPATVRSDVFSAAVVTCELLTGVPTFDCTSVPKTLYAIVNGQRADLAEQLGFSAPRLVGVLNHALALHPTERIPSAAALAHALEDASREVGPLATTEAVGKYLQKIFPANKRNVTDTSDPLHDTADASTEIGLKSELPADLLADSENPTPPLPKAKKLDQRYFVTQRIDRRRSPPTERIDAQFDPERLDSDLHIDPEGTEIELPDEADTNLSPMNAVPIPTDSIFDMKTSSSEESPWRESISAETQDVNEALSVLAFLQSQRGLTPLPTPNGLPEFKIPDASKTAPVAALDTSSDDIPTEDTTANINSNRRLPRIVLIIVGILLGVAGTIAVQNFLQSSSTNPAPEPALDQDNPYQ